ncbi:MAG: STAS domain-containing protein [Candidatus Promineifilaceae bacterium]|jgi:anti-anti-sigma factor
MEFDVNLEMVGSEARITLSGELDASSAPIFKTEIDNAAAAKATRLVFFMEDLTYMASAGLRSLIFARQKMGQDVDIYLIGTTEEVRDTLEMTGMQYSVILQDEYDGS